MGLTILKGFNTMQDYNNMYPTTGVQTIYQDGYIWDCYSSFSMMAQPMLIALALMLVVVTLRLVTAKPSRKFFV